MSKTLFYELCFLKSVPFDRDDLWKHWYFHIMNEWMNPSVCSVIEYIDMQRRNIVLHWCNTVGQPSVFQTSAQINDTLSFFPFSFYFSFSRSMIHFPFFPFLFPDQLYTFLFRLLFLFQINDTHSLFHFPFSFYFSRSIIHFHFFPFPFLFTFPFLDQWYTFIFLFDFTFPFPDQWYTFLFYLFLLLLLFQINDTLSFFTFHFSFSRSMIHLPFFPFSFYFSISCSMIHFPFSFYFSFSRSMIHFPFFLHPLILILILILETKGN